MKTIDSPLSHLLRKGPSQMEDNWHKNPSPPMNDFYSWKTPETFSFYHRPETQGQYFSMPQQTFSSSPMFQLNNYFPGGYSSGFSPTAYDASSLSSEEFGGGSSSYMMNGDRLAKLMAERAIKVSDKMQDQEDKLSYGYTDSMEGRLPELTITHNGKTEKAEQRVVGGRDVSDGEIPWQVNYFCVFLSIWKNLN